MVYCGRDGWIGMEGMVITRGRALGVLGILEISH